VVRRNANSGQSKRSGAGLALAHSVDNIGPKRQVKRLFLGIALVWVLSLVFINGRAYTALVLESSRRTQSLTQASSKKISAQELESQFVQANVFPADVKLRCEPAMTMWDYICSYTPKDRSFPPRLHFGVNVDSKRWVQVSRTVQLGFPIPPLGL
jgi:hypothetical protein